MRITEQEQLVINIGGKTRLFNKSELEDILINEGEEDTIISVVKSKLSNRSKVGIKKYGTTIWDNTDENYLKHLQDELLDGANYCEQQMRLGRFSSEVIELIESNPNDSDLGELVRLKYNKLNNNGGG